MTRTRYAELGLIKCTPTLWRFIDLTDDPGGKKQIVIGMQYRSKTEALADLDRYAKDFGCKL